MQPLGGFNGLGISPVKTDLPQKPVPLVMLVRRLVSALLSPVLAADTSLIYLLPKPSHVAEVQQCGTRTDHNQLFPKERLKHHRAFLHQRVVSCECLELGDSLTKSSETLPFNPQVVGSIPRGPTKLIRLPGGSVNSGASG